MSERNSAEWFDHMPLVSKESNGRSYEVWANGSFSCVAPNGDRFKGYHSAEDWLIEHGITNDEELSQIINEENGWVLYHSRWFELIVFEKMGDVWVESYCGEPDFEYDLEGFNLWIDEAIKDDAESELE